MNTQDERKAFEELPLAKLALGQDWVRYSEDDNTYYPNEDFCPDYAPETINFAWQSWQAATKRAEEKLEGCVVVPNDQIEVWWQDAEEPENFATQSKDLHFIADGLEDGDIMKIYEHHTIHMPSNTLYGAWIYKDGEHIFITGTKTDVEAARGGNEKLV